MLMSVGLSFLLLIVMKCLKKTFFFLKSNIHFILLIFLLPAIKCLLKRNKTKYIPINYLSVDMSVPVSGDVESLRQKIFNVSLLPG